MREASRRTRSTSPAPKVRCHGDIVAPRERCSCALHARRSCSLDLAGKKCLAFRCKLRRSLFKEMAEKVAKFISKPINVTGTARPLEFPQSLFSILYRLKHNGVGRRVTRVTWVGDSPKESWPKTDCYYTITKVKVDEVSTRSLFR